MTHVSFYVAVAGRGGGLLQDAIVLHGTSNCPEATDQSRLS